VTIEKLTPFAIPNRRIKYRENGNVMTYEYVATRGQIGTETHPNKNTHSDG